MSYEERGRIREAIGAEAERLAYLFSVTDRNSFFGQIDQAKPRVYDQVSHQIELVTPTELREMIELEVANLVEFLPRTQLRPESIDGFAKRFDSASAVISSAGMRAARQVLDEQRAKSGRVPPAVMPSARRPA